MKLAFSTGAVLLGALTLTASAQTTKPKQSAQTFGGTYTGGGDDCAAPDAIVGQGSFGYDNSVATTGAEGQNESICLFFGSTNVDADVWYSWTADADGDATWTLCNGGAHDSKIAVYPAGGCPVDGTSLVCNDDSCGLQSEVTWTVTNGTTYMLQLGSFPGGSTGSGTFDITIAGAPLGGDDCATPDAIVGQGTFPFDNTAATTGLEGQNETNCYFFGSSGVDADVWFSWTADADGDATWTMCGGTTHDSKIAVYPAGGCPTDGTSIVCNDDTCGLQSEVTWSVTNGSTYMLQLGSFPGGSTGAGTFDISIVPPAPPANDDCATPTLIAGQGAFAYDQTFATTGTEGQNETLCYDFGSSAIDADVWYEWTADLTGTATVSMCPAGSGDSKIAAWPAGGCPTDGTSIACNDDTCGLLSEISFPVASGTAYLLQIGTFPGGTTGSGDITITITDTIGTNYCTANTNSTGSASSIEARGSASIADDDLQLKATNAPAGQTGVFYFGANEVSIPFGDGVRCVAGATWRMPVVTEAGGSFDYDVDMTLFGGLIGAIGTTKYQCWYRDPAAAASGFNLSDAVSIDMVP